MTNTDWAAGHAQRIGKAVEKLRGSRGGVWLSNETAKAGHRISRTSLFELESGKRKSVSTAELCVLAWALKVPPIRLLYPELPDGPVEVIPGKTVPSITAATWFSGELTFLPELSADSDDTDRQAHAEIQNGAQLVRLSRERISTESRVRSLAESVARLRAEGGNPDWSEPLIEQIASLQKELTAIAAQLKQLDGAVVADVVPQHTDEKE